jgi:hypothetical protein
MGRTTKDVRAGRLPARRRRYVSVTRKFVGRPAARRRLARVSIWLSLPSVREFAGAITVVLATLVHLARQRARWARGMVEACAA